MNRDRAMILVICLLGPKTLRQIRRVYGRLVGGWISPKRVREAVTWGIGQGYMGQEGGLFHVTDEGLMALDGHLDVNGCSGTDVG